MEDAHAVELELDVDTAFFAVFDGHGGSEVSVIFPVNERIFHHEQCAGRAQEIAFRSVPGRTIAATCC